MGPIGSPNWSAMLDAAEDILREEGYAALTSRRVAERVGVKQRLVYYYFSTMDDLVVATFRTLAERELGRLRSALEGERPIHEIWNVCVHTSDARLIAEFTALANRVEPLRAEVIAYVETTRRMQIEALAGTSGFNDAFGSLPPAAVAVLATSVALSLTREGELGVSMGHAETLRLIDGLIGRLEP